MSVMISFFLFSFSMFHVTRYNDFEAKLSATNCMDFMK